MEDDLEKEMQILDGEYMGTPISSYSKSFVSFSKEEIVPGKVVRVEEDYVLVDVGAKTEGVILLEELTDKPVSSASEVVAVGDEIQVYVEDIEDKEGKLILSKKRADSELAWQRAKEAYENNKIVTLPVIRAVRGGLVVDVWTLRGFIPASQADLKHVENLEEYEGKELELKFIGLDQGENKVILSRRVVLEEEQKRRREDIFSRLKEGEIVEGVVTRLTRFGAFVDLGGASGLIHISEMSWVRLSHPSEVVKEGDKIKVMVLKFDRDSQRISLGLRQVQPDPWKEADKRYPLGKVVKGRVVRILNFGVFVRVDDQIEGLVRISEVSSKRIDDVEKVVEVGKEVLVKVIDLNRAEHRMYLSMKQVEQDKEMKEYQEKMEQEKDVTLGDVFRERLPEKKE
ncbi:MAG: 30S ribosomal protein S1 [Armatimonadetes bacterium CG07_land_8_20_14_0_80_40_9]|nr:MAG: 30S ribosomal protein S1 [Armatimonadetes bacterium CG07_land_8_20_14_0_80_40_9]